jgi:hypothetical protein
MDTMDKQQWSGVRLGPIDERSIRVCQIGPPGVTKISPPLRAKKSVHLECRVLDIKIGPNFGHIYCVGHPTSLLSGNVRDMYVVRMADINKVHLCMTTHGSAS